MRIVFDCSLVPGQRGGVGQYSYQLANALSRVDAENSYTFFVLTRGRVDAGNLGLPNEGNFRVAVKKTSVPFQLMRFMRGLPGLHAAEYMLGGIEADIVHSNSFIVPEFKDRARKLAVTVYDTSVMSHPECHRKINIMHCARGIKEAVERADSIIAISEHTKRDIIKYFNAPEELITVTHLAAGPEYGEVRDAAALASARGRYGLPENYILFIGSLEPRKNIKTLLEAYASIPGRLGKHFPLVIAGGKGWLNSDIPALVERLGIKDRVRFTGYIDGSDINAVYSGASVFAYPSLYEGFGLPILEAMSCGAPVITSNTSSMPEVAGDAACLVDPLSTGELASALRTVLEDEGLREKMKKKGLARAAMFSWDRCAHETLEVYRKIAASPKRA
jgi:glycosyltransferase involved in cell wall biosynthesis